MCIPGAFAGGLLANIGTAVTIGASLIGGVDNYNTNMQNAAHVAQQQQDEAQLGGVQDMRLRDQMRRQMETQRLELAGRGVDLDSPSAVFLGQQAATELAFASQAQRSETQARQRELSAEERAYRSRARLGLLQGFASAAGDFLGAAPRLWPGLSEQKVGANA